MRFPVQKAALALRKACARQMDLVALYPVDLRALHLLLPAAISRSRNRAVPRYYILTATAKTDYIPMKGEQE